MVEIPSSSDQALAPRVDWGDVLAVPTFYGREREKALITTWVLEDRCQVVSILGLGGIGKSALMVSLMHQLHGTLRGGDLAFIAGCSLLRGVSG